MIDHEWGSFAAELVCVIVNFGLGSRLLKSARRLGLSGGTIAIGRGTVNSHILEFIGLSDIRKEIALFASDRETAHRALDRLCDEYDFDKPNHGIAFTTSAYSLSDRKGSADGDEDDKRGADDMKYHIITVIVDRGRAEEVILAADKAGSKGGTIINARGSGINETSKLFSMEIEPEKEIVIILSEDYMTAGIVSAIREGLRMDESGGGAMYVQDANATYGIRR